MKIGDLVFLLSFLVAVGSLVVAAVNGIRGRIGSSVTILRRLGIGVALYFTGVVLVSLVTPRREVRIGEDQCSDDWCIAVSGVDHPAAGQATSLEVTFEMKSRARRAPQRERGVFVYLEDQDGRRFLPEERSGETPLDVSLQPLEHVRTTRTFLLPESVRVAGVVVTRSGANVFPRCCIIGDEVSLFHRRPIVVID
jgi:hypothetical protein